MFNINLVSDNSIKNGVNNLSTQLQVCLCDNGFLVEAELSDNTVIIKEKNKCIIKFQKLNYFYFALSILLERFNEESFTEEIKTKIDLLGVMLDCSRNAVLNVKSVKKYIRQLAILGYDYLELYTEDTYEIKEEPKFGYMRGRYSHEEIKELDDYSKIYGIELRPCIQVLAHLEGIFRWDRFKKINDTNNILLLREDESYALIDNMFKNISKCYSSKNINIGMDEAWLLGSGKFLNKNGYVKREILMIEHLKKVHEIAQKYGFKISMWNDMFFRIVNNNSYNLEGKEFPKDLLDLITDDMNLIYWEYFNDSYDYYDRNLKDSLKLSKNTTFAGAVLSWASYAPDNAVAQLKMKPAIKACIANKIKDILITSWGDDGSECSKFSILPTLLCYSKERFERNIDINKSSKILFGYTFDEFMKIDYVNRYINLDDYKDSEKFYGNACRYMLFNDPLMGFFDNNVREDADIWSKENKDILNNLSKNKNEFSYLFKTLASISDILIEKSLLGKKIKKAYDNKNHKELKSLTKTINITLKKLEIFIEKYQYQWYKENKSFGWEVQDVRLGGLERRLKNVKQLILDYTNNKIDKIEELEFDRIDSDETIKHGKYNPIPCFWKNIVSPQRFD